MSHETEAVKYWRSHEGNKRLFAEHAALSGKPASHIAQMIRDQGGDCSNSQAEKYINAYRLYYRLYLFGETEEIRELWQGLPPTYWVRMAEKQSRYVIDLQECFEFLSDEFADRTSTDAFSARIETAYNDVPEWRRKLSRAIKLLAEFDEKDYTSEIPPVVRKRLRLIFQRTARLIDRVLERANDGT